MQHAQQVLGRVGLVIAGGDADIGGRAAAEGVQRFVQAGVVGLQPQAQALVGRVQMNAGVEARKISTREKKNALPMANTMRLLIPKIFMSLSAGSSFEVKPATANIMESSQLTPMSRI